MDNLTKADKKELKKEQKQLERNISEKSRKRKKLFKNLIKYSLVLIILAGIGYGLFTFIINSEPSEENKFKEGLVHWHAKTSISVCGEIRSLENLGTEENLAGLPLLHTHGDNLIHIEGRPVTYDDVTLGRYFDSIDIPFSNEKLMEKTNGDKCPDGKEGELTVLLNKKPLENPVNYSVKDNDEFIIRFE